MTMTDEQPVDYESLIPPEAYESEDLLAGIEPLPDDTEDYRLGFETALVKVRRRLASQAPTVEPGPDPACPNCGGTIGQMGRDHVMRNLRAAEQAAEPGLDSYERGKQDTLERMRAMRLDWKSMPHAEFPKKWPDWKDYREVLPTFCSCRECILWSSGS